MAKCYHCGAETSLYFNGEPVCTACDDKHKSSAPLSTVPPKRSATEPDRKLPKSAEL